MDLFLASVSKDKKDLEKILSYEHKAIYEKDGFIILQDGHELTTIEDDSSILSNLCSFDVVSIVGKKIRQVVYSHGRSDNAVVVTDKCNSNCIMCPYTENYRKKAQKTDLNYNLQVIEYIPSDIKHLIITGGEPTLYQESFLEIMRAIREKFEDTELLLLTNGRTMSNKEFALKALNVVPERVLWGIPVHGPNSIIHDTISQTPGSFSQTEYGIKTLLFNQREVEIRIVISKLNYKKLEETACYIAASFPKVKQVTFMAMEMCGAAAINKELIWIDYETAAQYAQKAAIVLIRQGIKVLFYNFPLCKVNKGFWSLCADSITDYKIRYADTCGLCSVRSICGGVFSTTLGLTKMPLFPI